MQKHPVIVVQGAQFGSEAKGAVVAYLCLTRGVNIAIRTGAINAGHTVVHKGERFAMQQIPCGWVNPYTKLVIGPGAYIHPGTLWREVDLINRAMPDHDVRDRLFIDYRCGIHDSAAEMASKSANRHHRIGATGKGCSEAIVAKIKNRNDGYQLFADTSAGRDFRTRNRGKFIDTVESVNKCIDQGQIVLIEGTQGTLLDLHIGPYPYTTSRMTTAANWIAEAGLSPALDYEVILVCRTFPIRVAGNSGPMANEIEWLDLAQAINANLARAGKPPRVAPESIQAFNTAMYRAAVDASAGDRYVVPSSNGIPDLRLSGWSTALRDRYRVAASELHRDALNLCSDEVVADLRKLFEMTTVTKKLRRIARLDMAGLKYAITINRPSSIYLTFMDYVEPELADCTGEQIEIAAADDMNPLHGAVERMSTYAENVARETGVPVQGLSVGPRPDNMFQYGHVKVRQSAR